jgi:SAM-dependent methyltransferase
MMGCLDPLWIARRRLYQGVRERAHYLQGRLLDLGCGTQPYRELFSHVRSCVRLDLPPNSNIDVCGNGMALPFRAAVFDAVLCNQVLEHVCEPSQLMAEVARVLKPHGVLLLTTPQTWGLHLEPQDFYRFTEYGLRYLAQNHGLEVIEVAPTCGLWATLAQRLADTVINTYARGCSRVTYKLLALLMAPLLLAGDALDKLCGRRGDPLDHVLVARKSNGAA